MSKYRITLDGRVYEMEIDLVKEEPAMPPAGKKAYRDFRQETREPTVFVINPSAEKKYPADNRGVAKSPMPGTIIKLVRTEGETVRKGELVLILEAMKMENEISAPISGKIIKMNCAVGETVTGGAVLFEVQ